MRWRVLPSSRVEIEAQAPGHRFTCDADGLTGHVDIEGTRLEAIEIDIALNRLSAHDRLKDHEIAKYLDFRRGPRGRAQLVEPTELSGPADAVHGAAPVWVWLDDHRTRASARVHGRPELANVELQLRFTDFELRPPKMLFMKVKDELLLRVRLKMAPSDDDEPRLG